MAQLWMDSSFPFQRAGSPTIALWRAKPAGSGASTGRSNIESASRMMSSPGKVTSFPRSVKLKPSEVVWFSWIVYKSRKHRDGDRERS